MSDDYQVEMKPVHIARICGTDTVLGEHTRTPGLAITPGITNYTDGTGFSGYFQITHEASGWRVPVGQFGLDVYTARRIAEELGTIGVDWTADKDTLIAKLTDPEVKQAGADAVRRAKFPPAPDGATPDVLGRGEYPKRADQATARQMAAANVRAALTRVADLHEITGHDPDDDKSRRMFALHVGAMLGEYGIAHLLRRFHAVDPDEADAAARDLWEAFDGADSIGEFLTEWAEEYGIEGPERGDASRVGVAMPDSLSYEAVMRSPLQYPENGTVGSLRDVLAGYVQLADERFKNLVGDTHGREMTDEQWRDQRISHAASWASCGLIDILSWLAKQYPHLAIRAARMVDEVGTNGCEGWDDVHPITPGQAPPDAAPTDQDPLRCPICDSPDPQMHPATAAEGEVTAVCLDAFHSTTNSPDRSVLADASPHS